MTAVEAYQPLLQVAGFLAGWVAAMLTGLLFVEAGS